MASDPKIEPSPWSPITEEGKQKLKEFYTSADSAFNEQMKMMNIRWETGLPPTEKERIKTTREDKDDHYVR